MQMQVFRDSRSGGGAEIESGIVTVRFHQLLQEVLGKRAGVDQLVPGFGR